MNVVYEFKDKSNFLIYKYLVNNFNEKTISNVSDAFEKDAMKILQNKSLAEKALYLISTIFMINRKSRVIVNKTVKKKNDLISDKTLQQFKKFISDYESYYSSEQLRH